MKKITKIKESMLAGAVMGVTLIFLVACVLFAIFKNKELSNYAVLLTIMFATFPIILTIYSNKNAAQKRREIEVYSKNRQEWINELRKQIPAFLNSDSKQKQQEIYDYVYLLVNGMEERSMLIIDIMKLIIDNHKRLPENDENPKIYQKINRLKIEVNKFKKQDDECITINNESYLNEALLKIMQMNLKIEWERVKNGD